MSKSVKKTTPRKQVVIYHDTAVKLYMMIDKAIPKVEKNGKKENAESFGKIRDELGLAIGVQFKVMTPKQVQAHNAKLTKMGIA
ncbi:hypothetical protein [Flavobacterium filum]|uniref:hypothetical protein n=1 Tax=Flavobacterium filum TaxID=370974 RepID=UPI0023F48FFE|nr:hypothetical protein [Flavobacterium filum]